MVVMEEFGRALVLEPYLETVVICGGLITSTGSSAPLMKKLGAKSVPGLVRMADTLGVVPRTGGAA